MGNNYYRDRTFDVFLSYNSQEKYDVKDLVVILKGYGIKVWYDEDELRPGISWQKLMEAGIKSSKSGAIVIGNGGVGPWEDEEMQALLQLAVRLNLPVIPVVLPNAHVTELPIFLSGRSWVDFSKGYTADEIGRLIWGITSEKPKPKPLPSFVDCKNLDEYVAKRGHLVHKLKARDSTGRWAYYFILVEPDLEKAFLKSLKSSETIDLVKYGKIIASCYGEEPGKNIRTMLREKYGFHV